MEIDIMKKGDILVISVKGRMDALTAPDFDKKIETLLSQGENALILNLSELEYISSAGLRSILAVAKQVKARDGSFVLTELKGAVKEVFEISGFYSIFQVFESEEDALKQMT
jgi:anti-anti-sigma factor